MLKSIMKNHWSLVRIWAILFLLVLETFFCVKNNNDAEVMELVMHGIQSGDSPSKPICVDWALSETDCVSYGNRDNTREKDVLALCSMGEMESLRNRLIPEVRRNDLGLDETYRCLKSCNLDYHLGIGCPANTRYVNIASYQKPRNEGLGYFSTQWQSCKNSCIDRTLPADPNPGGNF